MIKFKATVASDIPANRLLSRSEGQKGVTIDVTPTGQKPDFRSTSALTSGQEVTVTITNKPTWTIEAGEAIRAGDNVAAGADGKIFVATGGNEIGYAITAGSAGKLVTFIKTSGDSEGTVIPDGGVTTAQIADKAITDSKLAKAKVDVPPGIQPKMVIGTTLETDVLGMVGYSQDPMTDNLAMYNFGGQLKTADPSDDNDAAHKKYVDDKTYDAAAITSGTLSTARIPNLAQSKITNLATDLAAKLTAQKAAAQADSTATDIEGLRADHNALLAKLRTAGIISS